MKVADVLAAKGPRIITVKPSDTVGTLSQCLRQEHIGAAVVTSDGIKLDGVVSERDIAYGLAVHKAELFALPVSEIMTKTVITCSLENPIGVVASTMLTRKVRHLPVLDGDRLVGMISIRDVLSLRLDELQHETGMLRSFASFTQGQRKDR